MAVKSTKSGKPKSGKAAAKPEVTAKAPKVHERKIKPSEADRLEKARTFAASYLEQRDGMDPQLAMDIVGSMDAETINTLVEEANTAVIERTKAMPPPHTPVSHDEKVPEAAETVVKTVTSFVEFPTLVTDATFAQEVLDAAREALSKNASEGKYKSIKKVLFAKLKVAVGVDTGNVVDCLGIKVEPYMGESVNLDAQLLLEAGVSPEQIKKGYKRTPYEDVRFTLPTEMKPKKEGK